MIFLANVHFSHESTQIYLISNGILSALVGGETTKIYEFYENLFDTIGSTVLLPCKATNKANIHWIDEVGKEITGQDPR